MENKSIMDTAFLMILLESSENKDFDFISEREKYFDNNSRKIREVEARLNEKLERLKKLEFEEDEYIRKKLEDEFEARLDEELKKKKPE